MRIFCKTIFLKIGRKSKYFEAMWNYNVALYWPNATKIVDQLSYICLLAYLGVTGSQNRM